MAREAAKKVNDHASPIVRTSAGLRDAIFDEIDSIRAGTSNPTRANAVAKLAMGVVETVRMELEVHRHLRNTANANGEDKLGGAMALGKALPLSETNQQS